MYALQTCVLMAPCPATSHIAGDNAELRPSPPRQTSADFVERRLMQPRKTRMRPALERRRSLAIDWSGTLKAIGVTSAPYMRVHVHGAIHGMCVHCGMERHNATPLLAARTYARTHVCGFYNK